MNSKGFTLIEMLFVIAIIALFATFAYPGYRESIIRARRVDGHLALMELANKMENYYSKQQTYQGATLGTGSATDVLSSKESSQKWYRLVITEQTDKNYTLQAIPRGTQALQDKACQTLCLNSYGKKSVAAGPAGFPVDTAKCW